MRGTIVKGLNDKDVKLLDYFEGAVRETVSSFFTPQTRGYRNIPAKLSKPTLSKRSYLSQHPHRTNTSSHRTQSLSRRSSSRGCHLR